MAQPKTKGWCKNIEEEIYEITAVITYCRYYNSDTTWGVYGFITEGNIPYYTQPKIDDFMDTPDVIEKKKRQKASVLSGKMQELHIGGEYTIKCTHKFDKTYGHQYNPIAIYPLIPKSEESQLKFLESLIPRTLAKNLTAEYPNIVEDVVKGKITKIDTSKVKGIGELTWIKVREKIIENYVMADILIMLAPLGITYAMIKKLSEDEPNPTLLKQTLKENPYILTRINGMGFKKVDALALKLNPDLLRTPQRLVAFVRHYFQEVGESDGHTWVSEEVVRAAISNAIPECVEYIDWLFDQSGLLHSEHGKVGLKYYYDIEKNIINYLNNKANTITKTVFTQEQIDKAIKDAEKEQGFQYSEEQVNVINTILNSTVGVITGRAGCVDCDTEFFNGQQWKKISEYQHGDKVLQYNEDGTANLVDPIGYIKQPQEYLYHFSTKYGVDQCISPNHNVKFVTQKLPNKIQTITGQQLKEKQESSTGFHGKFLTSFAYEGTGIDLSDDMIRLYIAVMADGSFNYNLKNETSSTYNRARVNVTKLYKKQRLEELLERNKIPYSFMIFNEDCRSIHYLFDVPARMKHFPKDWYNCNKHQLQVIADEVVKWDGSTTGKRAYKEYFTTSKADADFIQFVFSALGYRASILEDNRFGKPYQTCGKHYIRKSVCYRVSKIKNNTACLNHDKRLDHTKTKIENYKTKDGYEYCFTVPSHMLVLRRNNRIFITGNCGKTSISRAILKAYQNNHYSIISCALSAMAAKRISEASGYTAATIHRTLGAQGINKFTYNKDNPLIADVVFIDEASMINAKLFWDLLQAISDKTRIIISGDHKQLPPIGYGNIFSDVIDTLNSKYVCKLSKVMRQAAMSGILSDANLIRENINPITEVMQPKLIHGELQDMYYLFRDNRQRLFDIAVKTFVKSVGTDGIDNVVIITPRRKDCLNSAVELNIKIQDELIPSTEPSITCQDIEYRKGAKVMQIVNNYDENVFNGEIGFITDIKSENNGKKTVMVASVDFGGGKVIDYLQTEMAQLDLAYAVTVHKIQGSGIKTVIGIIDNSHYKLLDNCILYTLLTRAKKRCLLLAEPTAFNQCIRTSHNRRNTWIMEGAFKHRQNYTNAKFN